MTWPPAFQGVRTDQSPAAPGAHSADHTKLDQVDKDIVDKVQEVLLDVADLVDGIQGLQNAVTTLEGRTGLAVSVGPGCMYDPADYNYDEDAFYAADESLVAQGGGTIVVMPMIGNDVDGPGEYQFTKRGYVQSPYVSLLGMGPSVVIGWKPNGTADLLDQTPLENSLVTVSGFGFCANLRLNGHSTWRCPINGVDSYNGGGGNTLGSGITVAHARARVYNLHIEGMAEDGYRNHAQSNAHGVQASHLTIIGCGGNGMKSHAYGFDGQYGLIWIGSCRTGIELLNGANAFLYVHSWGNQLAGVSFNSGSDSSKILGGYIESNGKYGISWNGAKRTIVANVDLFANNKDGSGCALRFANNSQWNQVKSGIARDNRGVQIVQITGAKYNRIDGIDFVDTIGYNQDTLAFNTISVSTTNGSDLVNATSGTPFRVPTLSDPGGSLNCYLTVPGAGLTNAVITEVLSSTQARVDRNATVSVSVSTARVQTIYSIAIEGSNSTTFDSTATPNYYTNLSCQQYASGQLYLNPTSVGTEIRGVTWASRRILSANGSVTLDARAARTYDITFTGGTSPCVVSIQPPSPGLVGMQVRAFFRQASGGGKAISWPASVIWSNGTAPTVSTAGDTVLMVDFLLIDATQGSEVWLATPTGSAGAQGAQGAQGVSGPQGSPGAQGTAGAQGAQGSAGAQGSQGAQGSGSAGSMSILLMGG